MVPLAATAAGLLGVALVLTAVGQLVVWAATTVGLDGGEHIAPWLDMEGITKHYYLYAKFVIN
jgi:hypothetical protein